MNARKEEEIQKQFLKNNDNERLIPIRLQCQDCKYSWEPFGRGGLNVCPRCGTGWYEFNRGRRIRRVA